MCAFAAWQLHDISGEPLTLNPPWQLKKDSGIAYSEMLFFDDCNWGDNCADVERGCPGVVTFKTPSGMTVQNWNDGLAKFAKAKGRGAQN